MTRPAYVVGTIGTLPGAVSDPGGWADYPTTISNCQGDGWFFNTGTYRFLSEHCARVFVTDAEYIKVTRYVSGLITAGLGEYVCGAILTGAVGARYGTTLVSRLTAPDGTTLGTRTTVHRLPAGTKQVWVIGGAFSATTGQHVQSVSFPTGSSVTEVSEPATGTVVVDGWGSLRLWSTDGFYSVSGVLQGGAHATKRAEYTARIAKLAPTEVYFAAGTNDLTDGIAAADFQVALDAWVTATLAGAPGARIVLQSLLRRASVWEAALAPAYRTATAAVATARSCTHVPGLAILDAADLSTDELHPKFTSIHKIVTAITANTSNAYRTGFYCDSIVSGSYDPLNGVGYRGPVHLVRTARI